MTVRGGRAPAAG